MGTIGKCIKAYRNKYDIPLRTLCKEIGVSNGILCQIENGKKPGANTVLLLVEWLFGAGKKRKPRSRKRRTKNV